MSNVSLRFGWSQIEAGLKLKSIDLIQHNGKIEYSNVSVMYEGGRRNVYASKDLKIGDEVLRELPIISHAHLPQTEDKNKILLFAFSQIDEGNLGQCLSLIFDSCCYPTSEEALEREFRKLYPVFFAQCEGAFRSLKESPENLLVLYLHVLGMNSNTRRYLYLCGSSLDHSCAPNCRWEINYQGVLQLFATRDIPCGQEVNIAYDNRVFKLGFDERRELLDRDYFFICSCAYCRSKSNRPRCSYCGNIDANNSCGKCRKQIYCSSSCQKADWREHKLNCLK